MTETSATCIASAQLVFQLQPSDYDLSPGFFLTYLAPCNLAPPSQARGVPRARFPVVSTPTLHLPLPYFNLLSATRLPWYTVYKALYVLDAPSV